MAIFLSLFVIVTSFPSWHPNTGIGEAIVTRLAAEGARVIGVDLPHDSVASRLEVLMSRLQGLALPQDITAADAPQVLSSFIDQHIDGGQIDSIIHNAGLTRDKTLRRMTMDQFEQVVQVNLASVLRINEAFLDSEAKIKKGGRIVLLASINGIAGAFGQTNYAFTKAGLIGYAHALAPRLAHRQMTVNCLAPGFIETKMTEAMPPFLRFTGRRANAMSQSGIPEDIAAAAAFLCADGAAGVNGQTLRVCGLNAVGK